MALPVPAHLFFLNARIYRYQHPLLSLTHTHTRALYLTNPPPSVRLSIEHSAAVLSAGLIRATRPPSPPFAAFSTALINRNDRWISHEIPTFRQPQPDRRPTRRRLGGDFPPGCIMHASVWRGCGVYNTGRRRFTTKGVVSASPVPEKMYERKMLPPVLYEYDEWRYVFSRKRSGDGECFSFFCFFVFEREIKRFCLEVCHSFSWMNFTWIFVWLNCYCFTVRGQSGIREINVE